MPGPRNKEKKKKTKDAKQPNRQMGSLFIQKLPLEIRLEIYSHLFASTRLVWGERALSRIGRQRIASVPNTIAILRTCRQIRAEIGTIWLHQVLFCFESPEAMLNKLANIPIATRALVRHVRVSGDPLMLSWEDDDVYYRTHQVLKLLPGLALDRLTILGSRVPEVCYETLDKLVHHGTGWKELYYLSHNSTFLGYEHEWFAAVGDPDEDRYLRVPQPAGWQRVLEKRDSAGTGASVTIFRASSRTSCSVLLQPATRAAFVQTLPPGKDLATFGKEEDAAVMAPGEREKEVLVIVRRGRGVDYAEKENSHYLKDGDIREDSPGKSWKQIKAGQDKLLSNDDDDFFSDDEDDPPVVENYTCVDEYVWPPLHFQPK
ncbi:hypothetical protein MSAN_01133200 [Mycena sanguinolenta]|uniref:F-box domain-containing protein n=1 Tax=Mycena sanguinolenta TaxID=230812 RepID=A0A8H6YJK7_9AGAR|nr:hypothetical protein MSAN_01133200 [Mycena sanguinolenta]